MSDTITVAVDASTTVRKSKTFFGHPAGLYILFFTEMWERFSYYGMRALLILYMVKHLIDAQANGEYIMGFGLIRHLYGGEATQPLASHIYGLYTALVYLTPIFGGRIADRMLGQRKTVYLGGVLMAIGHFLMASESLFLLALFFLILGNGCFKPNISTQVGSLYPEGDHRRDGAFVIFYMGVNLGALLSPLVCGTLGQLYGWHYGFTAAGVGMCIGLAIYHFGQPYLAQDQLTRDKAEEKVKEAAPPAPLTSKEWKAIGGLLVLVLLNIVFWGTYEQQGNTLQLFADSNTDWHIFGWNAPSTWLQMINPFFIFVMGPVLIKLWSWQSKKGTEPASVTKMAMGCIMLALGFVVLMLITRGLQPDQKISFLWLVLGTFVLTVGELYLSPIGLSLVTKIAPVHLVSLLMGTWYLSSFFGNYLSGSLGTYYDTMPKDMFFMMLAALAGVAGLAMFALNKPLKNAVGHTT